MSQKQVQHRQTQNFHSGQWEVTKIAMAVTMNTALSRKGKKNKTYTKNETTKKSKEKKSNVHEKQIRQMSGY